MSKRLILTENEIKNIRRMYNLTEDDTFSNELGPIGKMIIKTLEDIKSGKSSTNTDSTSSDSNSGFKSGQAGQIKHNYSGEKGQNIKLMIDAMNEYGITDPMAQIGILSVIGKETNYIPKSEKGYENTSNSRIRKLFGRRVPSDDNELNSLKRDPRAFFNRVYAKTVGNQGGNDGWMYRGRGFNQLTGKKNYEKYARLTGTNIDSSPESLNDPKTAAKVAIMFFTKGKKGGFPKFNSKKEAAEYFADINAGGRTSMHRPEAVKYSETFDLA